MTVQAVWNIADIFNALMAFPNLIALVALSRVVFSETKNYFGKSDDEKGDISQTFRQNLKEARIKDQIQEMVKKSM